MTGGAAPLLTVVVPAFDVADYLGECLASILGQPGPRLEVVIVDDGSTDRTGDLADELAEGDPRVRVLHQANAGLGAARNNGVALATGDYLAFADSDDLVCAGAYKRLVGSLEASASDLAIGSVERFHGDRVDDRTVTPLMRRNHRETLTAVRIEDAPLMLADVFAWNKVFRRSFWDRAELAFPTGVRYEDQPAITRALIAAEHFDSVPEPVYLWRIRSDGSSISQQRTDPRDLGDRILTKRWSTQTVREHLSAAAQQVWFAQVLPIDMWEYFRAVPGCDAAFWRLLRDGVHEFWSSTTVPFEETSLPLRQRLMGWLVAEDRRADLESFLEHLDRHPGPLPQRVIGGRVVVEHPFSAEPALPAALARP